MADDRKKKKAPFSADAKGSRAEKIAGVISGANEEFKRAIMRSADDRSVTVVPRVSTGLYGLDVASNGGMPMGRIAMVYGHNGGGKTTLLLRALADAQRRCANCWEYGEFEKGKMEIPDFKTGKLKKVETLLIKSCPCGDPRDVLVLWNDAENVWNGEWAAKMGVWPERVMLLKPTYGEQAYDVITSFVAIKEIDIIVIDSIAQLTPLGEFKGAMGDQQQGLAARMNNKFLRKLVGGMCEAFNDDRPIALWMVNQYRQKIGVMFGPSETLPGGMGQQFATSLEIEMRKGKIDGDDETGEPLFGHFKWTVKKNKVGVAGGKGAFQQSMCETDVFKVGDLMEHESVIDKAVDLHIVDHPNNVMYEYDGKKFRGKSSLVRFLGENPTQYADLKSHMLRLKLGLSMVLEDAEK